MSATCRKVLTYPIFPVFPTSERAALPQPRLDPDLAWSHVHRASASAIAREEFGDQLLRYRTPEFSTVFSEKMSISAGPHRLYTEGCPDVCTKQPWATSSECQFIDQEQQNSKGDK
jgi:hypothetical protein